MGVHIRHGTTLLLGHRLDCAAMLALWLVHLLLSLKCTLGIELTHDSGDACSRFCISFQTLLLLDIDIWIALGRAIRVDVPSLGFCSRFLGFRLFWIEDRVDAKEGTVLGISSK